MEIVMSKIDNIKFENPDDIYEDEYNNGYDIGYIYGYKDGYDGELMHHNYSENMLGFKDGYNYGYEDGYLDSNKE